MPEDKKKFIKQEIIKHNIQFIRLQFVDINSRVKSVEITPDYIDKALNGEMMLDGSSIKGFRNIETSDMFLIPDLDTFKVLPHLQNNYGGVAALICDIYNVDGKPFEGCPRCNLKRIMSKAFEYGYDMHIAPEIEFFLFKKDSQGNITLNSSDKAGYYDIGPEDSAEDVKADIVRTLKFMGIEIEAIHHEIANGQHEIDLKHLNLLMCADSLVLVKSTIKYIAAKHGLYATFMPKPLSTAAGSGMHCNISIFKDGENAFYEEGSQLQLSDLMLYSIGSIMKHVKGFTAITNPTVNSYKRLVPGFDAPIYLAWSLANRSALLRVPSKRKQATRVELRSPDTSCNPYLAFAVMLEACLDGVRNKIEPPELIDSNIYALSTKERKKQKIDLLPTSLFEAVTLMEKSIIVKVALGEPIFNEFLRAKKKEWFSYKAAVSQWEIDTYLEQL